MSDDREREPEGDWESVAEMARRYEAELAAGRLRESGIDARIVDQSFHQEPLPSVRSFAIVRVYVPARQADEARRILVHPAEPPGGEDEES